MWNFLPPGGFYHDWHQYFPPPRRRGWVLTRFDRELLSAMRIACD